MKNLKRTLAILLAAAMTMAMGAPAMADTADTGSITITPPAGVDPKGNNIYRIYKVFDATSDGTNIAYKLLSGRDDVPCNTFIADDARNVYHYNGEEATKETEGAIAIQVNGEVKYIVPSKEGTGLSAEEIKAIAEYVRAEVEEGGTPAEPDYKAESTGTAAATASPVALGYYYIATTTGSVVMVDSTNKDASVNDKNSIPRLDKTITGASSYDEDGKTALAQVGTTVNYKVVVTAGKGAKNYAFHDKMDAGLLYNGDAAVTGLEADMYRILKTPEDDDTITIKFADGIAEDTEITITYSATVTSDALQDSPAKNTAKITYGEGYTTTSSETKVYNAKFTITKKDGDGNALEGAGFVIARETKVADTSEGAAEGATISQRQYYKLVTEKADGDESTAAVPRIDWVDNIEDATEYKSDAKGDVPAFTGLANGTYTVIEKTVPAGYNKAEDRPFEIAEHNYEAGNLEQTAEVINNAGVVLPHTGGIGTTLFTVIGTILVIGAGVMLVARRRMEII